MIPSTDGAEPSSVPDEPIRNGRVLQLLCEGACSRFYDEEDVVRLRAAGWGVEEIRAHTSSRMVYRDHVRWDVREGKGAFGGQVDDIYKCLRCGHERRFGASEK